MLGVTFLLVSRKYLCPWFNLMVEDDVLILIKGEDWVVLRDEDNDEILKIGSNKIRNY